MSVFCSLQNPLFSMVTTRLNGNGLTEDLVQMGYIVSFEGIDT